MNAAMPGEHLGILMRFSRRGLKAGAILGIALASLMTMYHILVLIVGIIVGAVIGGLLGLLSGFINGLAVIGFVRVFPALPYRESGRRILSSLLVGGCTLLANAAILGGSNLWQLTAIVTIIAAVIASFSVQDILHDALGEPPQTKRQAQ